MSMSVKAVKSERALKEAAQVQQFSKYIYHSLKRTCHKVLPQLGALPFLDLDISGGKARELSLSSGYIAHYTVRKYTHNTHLI